MDVLIIVDMQCGLLEGDTKLDLDGVVRRINQLSLKIRDEGGAVVWIRHCGNERDGFEPDTPGWNFLPDLARSPLDVIVEKTFNDAFAGTTLDAKLEDLKPTRLIICGWATDFCVDSTIRSSVAHGYAVTVISDGHTLADRPHLNARQVKQHHHWLWQNLIAPTPVRIALAEDILTG